MRRSVVLRNLASSPSHTSSTGDPAAPCDSTRLTCSEALAGSEETGTLSTSLTRSPTAMEQLREAGRLAGSQHRQAAAATALTQASSSRSPAAQQEREKRETSKGGGGGGVRRRRTKEGVRREGAISQPFRMKWRRRFRCQRDLSSVILGSIGPDRVGGKGGDQKQI
eukprot:764701-Hanusia_phi.AAC.1